MVAMVSKNNNILRNENGEDVKRRWLCHRLSLSRAHMARGMVGRLGLYWLGVWYTNSDQRYQPEKE